MLAPSGSQRWIRTDRQRLGVWHTLPSLSIGCIAADDAKQLWIPFVVSQAPSNLLHIVDSRVQISFQGHVYVCMIQSSSKVARALRCLFLFLRRLFPPKQPQSLHLSYESARRSISFFTSEAITTWMIPRKMCTQNVSQTIADTHCGFPNRAVHSRPATDKMDSRSGMLAMSVRRAHSTFFSTYVMDQTMLFINVPASVSALIPFHLILITKSTSYPMLILLVVSSLPLA